MTAPKVIPLYELVDAYEEIGEQLLESGGELTDDLKQRWDDIQEKLPTKIENTALYCRNLDATAKAMKVEADRFAAKAKAMANVSKRLKDYLKFNMERAAITKVNTVRVNARIQRNPRPSITWTRSPDYLPARFQKVSITLDGDFAYREWKESKTLPDGFEVETGTHLRLS